MAIVRRKCFISYHHADQRAVNQFMRDFDHESDCFIARGLAKEMPRDVIQSTNTDYIMRRIREKFLGGSTVTLVLMGRCTWARRYVDWELQSSLRHGDKTTPNGLLGIKLPSFGGYPPRFSNNLSNDWPRVDCYAQHMEYPQSTPTGLQHRGSISATNNSCEYDHKPPRENVPKLAVLSKV